MKPTKETNLHNWTPQIWPGNPALNLVCSCKLFINPYTGKKVPVYVFGGTKEYQGFNFTVSAGANSDFSYTGRAEGDEIHIAQQYVDTLANNSKLFE